MPHYVFLRHPPYENSGGKPCIFDMFGVRTIPNASHPGPPMSAVLHVRRHSEDGHPRPQAEGQRTASLRRPWRRQSSHRRYLRRTGRSFRGLRGEEDRGNVWVGAAVVAGGGGQVSGLLLLLLLLEEGEGCLGSVQLFVLMLVLVLVFVCCCCCCCCC